MKRRNFLKSAIAAGVTLVCGSTPVSIDGNKKVIDIDSTLAPDGIKDIEGLFSDIHPGDFIIIGNRPGISKMDISYRLLRHFVDRKKATAFFNYEISKENAAMHILSSDSHAEDKDLLLRANSGRLEKKDWAKLVKTTGEVSDFSIYIDDTPATTKELCNKIKALNSMQQGLGIIIIDCLQLLKANGHYKGMEQNIIEASKALKHLANELKVPVVAFTYLKRNVELTAGKRPVLADIGLIEQYADMVIFLHRNDITAGQKTTAGNHIEVMVAKNRHGGIYA